ncbi:unnamed protein product [Dibothriocephalus latus]|uniref:RING-type domain-containing protein n=1 Tax=Dibothriocephalus latus TaxID=60516 RepID=A0A3P7NYX2_DIBLA|nr:unnamed protein product [Dibothriocephalus latus]
MVVSCETLLEAAWCSICQETCTDAYRLPCEHVVCREPCLQRLLNAERPTCPNCRLVFSEADVEPFQTVDDFPKLIQEPSQTKQHAESAKCPICVRKVYAPLQMSEHFSKRVCGDCWRTGEMLRECIMDEPPPREPSRGICRSGDVTLQDNQQARGLRCPVCCRMVETPLRISEHFSKRVCGDCWKTGEMLREYIVDEPIQGKTSAGIHRNKEVAVHDNQQAREGWCSFCSQWVDTPLQMTPYFSEPVCTECMRSAERGLHSNSRKRGQHVGEQGRGNASYFAPEEESGNHVSGIERMAAQNPPATSTPHLPRNAQQHARQDAQRSSRQGVDISAEETHPAPRAPIRVIEPTPTEISGGILSSGEVFWHNNQQNRGKERCLFCFRWVETPLQWTAYYSEQVCNECRRSAEMGVQSSSHHRSQNGVKQDRAYGSYIAPEEDCGYRVIYVERSAAGNPPTVNAIPLPSNTPQLVHTTVNSKDARRFKRQGIDRCVEEAIPASRAPTQRETSAGVRCSRIRAVQHNPRAAETRYPFCYRSAGRPLQMTTYSSEPVCNECRRSVGWLKNNSIQQAAEARYRYCSRGGETPPQSTEISSGSRRWQYVPRTDYFSEQRFNHYSHWRTHPGTGC